MTAFENTPGRMRPFRAGDCPTRVPRVGLENDEKGRGHAARPLAAAERAVSEAVLQDEKRTSVRLLPSMDRRGFLKRVTALALASPPLAAGLHGRLIRPGTPDYPVARLAYHRGSTTGVLAGS